MSSGGSECVEQFGDLNTLFETTFSPSVAALSVTQAVTFDADSIVIVRAQLIQHIKEQTSQSGRS